MRLDFRQVVATILLVSMIFCAFTAHAITPYADSVFVSAYAYINSSKQLSIRSITYAIHEEISIIDCWYEIQSGSDWVYVSDIPEACVSTAGMKSVGVDVDCSLLFTSGTYRVGFEVDADGYSITRYSNEYAN